MSADPRFGNSGPAPKHRGHVTTLLMVDDDEPLVELTREYLEPNGFKLHGVHQGDKALAALERVVPELVILDVMLPGLDGFQVCQQIRRTSKVPILMLTARGEDTDRILGLEMGADDYLAKPFNPRELLARIKAILRRAGQPAETEAARRYEVGPVVLDMGDRAVTVRGEPVDLTTAEFDLLRVVIASAGRALSRDQLMDRLHGTNWEYFDRSIDVQISRIRQKIEQDPRRPKLLKTIRGVGYQFIKPGEEP
jgi:two-component system, OmpR family, response regulator RstA